MNNYTCLDNEYCRDCEYDKDPETLFWYFYDFKEADYVSAKELIKVFKATGIENFNINDIIKTIENEAIEKNEVWINE